MRTNTLISYFTGLFVGFALGFMVFYHPQSELAPTSLPSIPAGITADIQEPAFVDDIDPYAMMYGVISAESNFRHRGYKGSAGERGYTQLRKIAWIDGCKYLKVNWPYQPNVWVRGRNIIVSTAYHFWLWERWEVLGYEGEELLRLVVMSYNAGYSNIAKGRIPRITRRHWIRFKKAYDRKEGDIIWHESKIGQLIEKSVDYVKERKSK